MLPAALRLPARALLFALHLSRAFTLCLPPKSAWSKIVSCYSALAKYLFGLGIRATTETNGFQKIFSTLVLLAPFLLLGALRLF